MLYAVIAIISVVIGIIVTYFLMRNSRKNVSNEDVNTSLATISREALRQNSQDFLMLARETLATQTQTGISELEAKKHSINQTLDTIKSDLLKVEQAITAFDNKRDISFTAINEQLKNTSEQTNRLQTTTGKLQEALSSTKSRGQWGERMAEDILRLAGFIENVNYIKQKNLEGGNTRPDYTFFLPRDMKVNMDVKFPRDNYIKYLNEENETLKETYKQHFIKDTRQRVKEVLTRDYINPAENTVDYVMVFIPNEQIYSFINECDNTIIDEAIKQKVILCSPLTLYAILAIIRQAIDSFNIQKTTANTLALFGTFNKQWEAFKESMETMGKYIDRTRDEYQKIVTTRTNTLEKPLRQIEELRKQEGIEEASVPAQDGLTIEKNNQ
ncbi:MAG: DNA recombination protein RmuC [Dehalococcoidales bacterium]|nr:DNA recombination protein RmuC [Dehalococcoidales bacterium]